MIYVRGLASDYDGWRRMATRAGRSTTVFHTSDASRPSSTAVPSVAAARAGSASPRPATTTSWAIPSGSLWRSRRGLHDGLQRSDSGGRRLLPRHRHRWPAQFDRSGLHRRRAAPIQLPRPDGGVGGARRGRRWTRGRGGLPHWRRHPLGARAPRGHPERRSRRLSTVAPASQASEPRATFRRSASPSCATCRGWARTCRITTASARLTGRGGDCR